MHNFSEETEFQFADSLINDIMGLHFSNKMGAKDKMDVLSFIYNILLLILYAYAISSCFYAWMNTKHKIYIRLIELFIFFLFDLSIIYIAEFVYRIQAGLTSMPEFSFSPLRTIIFVIGLTIYMRLFLALTERAFKPVHLIPYAIFLLCTILSKNTVSGLAANWLYYSARYFSMILMLVIFLVQMRIWKDTIDAKRKALALKLDLIILVFMGISFVESTLVIINWQAYSRLINAIAPRLSQRIFTEDIYSVIFSFWCIFLCHRVVKDKLNAPVLSANMLGSIPDKEFYAAMEAFALQLGLTNREREILNLLLKDKTNQEISDELIISLGTVKTHVHNILQKANVTKRSQLMDAFRKMAAENSHK